METKIKRYARGERTRHSSRSGRASLFPNRAA
jgi:hypothetical protein